MARGQFWGQPKNGRRRGERLMVAVLGMIDAFWSITSLVGRWGVTASADPGGRSLWPTGRWGDDAER